MADEDRAVMERLAALEAEVKADADAAHARKTAALAKLRDQRVTQTAERDALRTRQAELVGKRSAKPAAKVQPAGRDLDNDDSDDLGLDLGDLTNKLRNKARAADIEDLDARGARAQNRLDDLGGAIELASKANRVKNELTAPRKHGDKSWAKSAAASFALGPIGWLYAGSMREAVPASAAWILVAGALYKFLPFFFLPVMAVVLPLSAIAGVVYALQYNRSGGRQRLFDGNGDKAKPKQLREG